MSSSFHFFFAWVNHCLVTGAPCWIIGDKSKQNVVVWENLIFGCQKKFCWNPLSSTDLSAIYFKWVEYSPMVRETGWFNPRSSHTRPKKFYLILLYWTLGITSYRSRVKWSNPGKGGVLSRTPRCCSYRKGTFGSPSTTVARFTYFVRCSAKFRCLSFITVPLHVSFFFP